MAEVRVLDGPPQATVRDELWSLYRSVFDDSDNERDGYTGERGQWWTDRAAAVIDPARRHGLARWTASSWSTTDPAVVRAGPDRVIWAGDIVELLSQHPAQELHAPWPVGLAVRSTPTLTVLVSATTCQ